MNSPLNKEDSLFNKLWNIDCSKHTETKGKFTYLSWPWAVRMLRENDPSATWEVVKHNGLPYCETPAGCFVEVAVTASGVTLSQIHPVLNNNNQTISKPNAFQVNTSIMRCLVKAIALHGLGLYIYAGEDLPESDEEEKPKVKATKITPMGAIIAEDKDVQAMLSDDEQMEFLRGLANELIEMVEVEKSPGEAYSHLQSQMLKDTEKLALWVVLQNNSKTRSALQTEKAKAVKAAKELQELAGAM